jgi:ABC-type lipoprotein export system ATPase subunit
MSAPGLVCQQLRLQVSDVKGQPRVILDDVNADFQPGRIALIEGATGAGKSSLLGLLALLRRPSSGEVMQDGVAISRRQLGLLLQTPLLLSRLNCVENIVVSLLPRGVTLSTAHDMAFAALDKVAMREHAQRGPEQLSGGERQRVALARAIAGPTQVLLLDEPTAHQDPEGVARVASIINVAAAHNAVVVVASHDPRLRNALRDVDRWQLHQGLLEPST